MKQLSRHLNPATVISCIALFVALSGVAYAAGLGKKSVKTQHLGNGSVTTLKLRNGAVNTPKLRNQAVTTAKLRNLAVSAAKLGNGAVVAGKLANGAVRASALGGGVVTTAKLQNDAVNTAKLANNAVGTDKLAGVAVSAEKLAPNSVATGKLQDGAVSAAKLNSGLLAQLVKDVSYQTSEKTALDASKKEVTAPCPAGKQVVGGGHRIETETAESVTLLESLPFIAGDGKRTGWTVVARGDGGAFAAEAYAICAEF